MNIYSIIVGIVAFYGFGLFIGKRIRDFRDRQEWVATVTNYFETSSQQATCLCDAKDDHCFCDEAVDKHRDDQQTTD